MKYYKYTITALFAITIIGTPWLVNHFPRATHYIDVVFSYTNNLSAVFMREAISIAQLKEKYNSAPLNQIKVKVLIVPGHEPDYGGAEYGNLKEREMTVELSKYLSEFFYNNPHYEVIVARDGDNWNKDLKTYFENNWESIRTFVRESKNEMLTLVNNGKVAKNPEGVLHNNAPTNVALRLYGINKWANDNKIDMVIHVHFNDYPRKNHSVSGEYSGLSIYVPERQYSNSTTTRVIAKSVFNRLSKYNAVSNLPIEDSGIVEEQELIAIGSHNTLDAPSMLVEYGYIYESQFADKEIRSSTLKDLAFQTYLGVQDFFGAGNDVSLAYDTLMLPYKWDGDITKDTNDKNAVLALQTALVLEDVYPPKNKSKNDCPRSGKFGPCTANALSEFQRVNGIKNEKDRVGQETKKVLNNKYSVQIK